MVIMSSPLSEVLVNKARVAQLAEVAVSKTVCYRFESGLGYQKGI